MSDLLIVQETEYPPKIGKTDIFEYNESFKKQGIKTNIYCTYSKKIENVYSFPIDIRNHRRIIRDFFVSFGATIHILTRSREYSVVYILNPLTFGWIIGFVGKMMCKKVIFDVRTVPIRDYDFIYKLNISLEKISMKIADKVVVIHEGLINKLGIHKFENKIVVSPLGYRFVDILEDNADYSGYLSHGNGSNNAKFIYIGTIDKKRGLDVIINAFIEFPGIELFILGDGTDRERLLDYSKNKSNIHFLDTVIYTEVHKYLLGADYGISYIPMVDLYEYQPPLKTIEYLGSGLPVLATKTVGNQMFVKDGENGILCSDALEGVKDGIRRIMKLKVTKSEIVQSASKWEWDTIIGKLVGEVPELKKLKKSTGSVG